MARMPGTRQDVSGLVGAVLDGRLTEQAVVLLIRHEPQLAQLLIFRLAELARAGRTPAGGPRDPSTPSGAVPV